MVHSLEYSIFGRGWKSDNEIRHLMVRIVPLSTEFNLIKADWQTILWRRFRVYRPFSLLSLACLIEVYPIKPALLVEVYPIKPALLVDISFLPASHRTLE